MSTQASNTTTHYGLSQWAETDRVLREDFNHDNAAIDAAIKANADQLTAKAAELDGKIAWVKLLETAPTTAAAASATLDLSALDFSPYLELRLDIWIATSSTQSPRALVAVNGGSTKELGFAVSSGQIVHASYFLYESGMGVLAAAPNHSSGSFLDNCGLTGLQSMTFTFINNSTPCGVTAGFHAMLYGLKK